MNDRIKVLLIEDNPGDARLIREMLAEVETPKFDLEWVKRLSAGLERLDQGGIDALLLDLGLPDSQGLDTFTRVHAQAPNTPIIVLTGLDDELLAVQAVRAGAQDYLAKGQVAEWGGGPLARAMRYAIERQRTEETLRRHNRELALLHHAGQTLASTLDLDQVLDAILGETRHLLEIVACSVWLVDRETGDLVCRQATGPKTEIMRGWRLPPGVGLAGWVVRTGESLNVSDTRDDERYFTGVDEQTDLPLRSVLSAPLRVKGSTIGVIQVVDAAVDRFGPTDLALLEPLAATAAIAVENARLFQAERERSAQLAAVAGVSEQVTSILDLDDLLRETVELITQTFGYYHVSIMLLDEKANELVLGVVAGGYKGRTPADFRQKLEKGMIGWAARLGETVWSNDVSQEPRFIPAYLPETRSELDVPLKYHDRVIGVLDIQSKKLDAFNQHDVLAMETLAGHVAAAIENARLYAETDRLRVFNENIVQGVDEGIILEDANGRITFANPRMAEMLGYAPQDLAGRHWRDIALPEQVANIEAEYAKRPQGIAGRYESVLLTRDGQPVPVIVSGRPLFEEGCFTGTLAVFIDITERVQAEESLRQAKIVIENSPTVLFRFKDDGGTFEFVSENVAQFGYTAEELVSEQVPYTAIVHPDDLGPIAQEMKEHLEHGDERIPLEYRILTKDGATRWTSGWVMVEKDHTGWITHYQGVVTDVTEQREMQQQLEQQERLATVGQMAAGIAHDFNNILASIILSAELGLRETDTLPRNKSRMETVRQQGRRAADLVQQILDFSRKAILSRKHINLVSFMQELQQLLERTLPESIHLHLTYGADDYVVNADPTRIQQAIMNLAVNARDAMPEGGKLHFDLSHFYLRPGDTAPFYDMEPGVWVQLMVNDTGAGIPPEVLPHIYEPFFTTKGVGKGTGLGLSQVFGIVKQHKGHIDVESQVGSGTTFTIYLPALRAPDKELPKAQTEDITGGSGEVILVVEDDAVTRKALTDVLDSLNYQVLVAANGREALDVFEQHKDEIALVLSDLVMPEMGGLVLFQVLKRRYPAVRVVVLTGYPKDKDVTELQAAGVAGWLRKPVRLGKLAQAIAQALKEEGWVTGNG